MVNRIFMSQNFENIMAIFGHKMGVLAIRTVTAGFARFFCVDYARLCCRFVIQDTKRDIFSFQLRTPISGEPFFCIDPHQPRLSPTPWPKFGLGTAQEPHPGVGDHFLVP